MPFQHDWINEGADPTDNDIVIGITAEGQCDECGYQFDMETIDNYFTVEESGVSDMAHFGPPVYWATGYVTCPQCAAELPYETSS